jgi:hypothetical protein
MPDLPETLTTDLLFDAKIDLRPPEALGQTPLGGRTIFIIEGGTFQGPQLSGTVRQGGGDWFLAHPNGAGELDVRLTLETHDGALILMTYRGVFDVDSAVVAEVFAGNDVDPSRYYFRTTPRFETGDQRYAWLNKLVCVGAGWFAPNLVGYRIFAIR